MAIGLDIGTSAVRVAELEQRRGGLPRLTRYGEVPLPPGTVVEGEVVEPVAVTDCLRQLWAGAGLRRREVAVGLASQKVTVREIELPDMPDADLADALRLQAQDQLPMPPDQALLDYVVVRRATGDGERRNVRVLLVAAERNMVERFLSSVTAAKLRPVLVDLDAFALLRSVATSGTSGSEAELIVDVGATVTKIAVHCGGQPLFVRMVRLGGDAATRQLQDVLELSWEEAEKAKLDASEAISSGADLAPDDERARALQTSVRRVATEVSSSLDFFRSQHDDVDVQRVLLTGRGSLAPNLSDDLEAAVEIPVGRGDPLRMVATPDFKAEPGIRDLPFLAVPVGLAQGLLA